MKSVVFLASGGGGNFKFFHFALNNNLIAGIKLCVIADRECGSLEFAKKHNIENHLISYKRSNPEALNQILDGIKPDIIVTNWHKIIDEGTVAKHLGKFVNLHYSLLPAFGGLIGVEPIKRAYEQGCKFIGPTCHLVDEGVDTGKILSQAIFTTERPFEDAVNLMFRKGCLVLLSGIQQILGQNISTACAAGSDGSYSPQLSFDESLFNEQFWKEIAAA
jgi:phosphoribosylglycinamide formyltransferase-1